MNPTAAPAPRAPSSSPLAGYVRQQIGSLSAQYLANLSIGVQGVAALSKEAGKEPGGSIAALRWTMDAMPAELGRGGLDPSGQERSAFAAITLYALHQKSLRDVSMQVPTTTFGAVLGKHFRELERNGGYSAGVLSRFNAAGTAGSWEELTTHLRSLIQLLKRERLGFDYGRFADDLSRFQDPTRRDAVRLTWGRDFYRTPRAPGSARLDSETSPNGVASPSA